MSENEKEREEAERKKTLPSLASERLQIGSVLLAVAFAFLFNIVAQSLLNAILCELFPRIYLNDWYEWLIAGIPLYFVSMPLSLVFFAMGRPSEKTGGERISPWVWLGLLSVCLALTYAGSLLGVLVNLLIGNVTGVIPENGLDSLTTSAPLWENLLFVGIAAPVIEEFFLRKLVIDRLRRYGGWFAILASGVIFGIIHGNFYQFFYTTLMGILFGYLYLRTERLRYTVALHMAINLFGGVYAAEMLKVLDASLLERDPVAALLGNPVGAWMLAVYLFVIVAAFLGAIVGGMFLWRHWGRGYKPTPAARLLSRKEWARVLLLNPAFWVFLVFAVFMML